MNDDLIARAEAWMAAPEFSLTLGEQRTRRFREARELVPALVAALKEYDTERESLIQRARDEFAYAETALARVRELEEALRAYRDLGELSGVQWMGKAQDRGENLSYFGAKLVHTNKRARAALREDEG